MLRHGSHTHKLHHSSRPQAQWRRNTRPPSPATCEDHNLDHGRQRCDPQRRQCDAPRNQSQTPAKMTVTKSRTHLRPAQPRQKREEITHKLSKQRPQKAVRNNTRHGRIVVPVMPPKPPRSHHLPAARSVPTTSHQRVRGFESLATHAVRADRLWRPSLTTLLDVMRTHLRASTHINAPVRAAPGLLRNLLN